MKNREILCLGTVLRTFLSPRKLESRKRIVNLHLFNQIVPLYGKSCRFFTMKIDYDQEAVKALKTYFNHGAKVFFFYDFD